MPTSTSSTPQSRQAIEEGLLEHDQEQLKAEGDEYTTDQDPDMDWTDQVMDPILKTPSKSLSSSKRKHKSPVATQSASKSSASSTPSSKVPRLLLPSPGKRYLQQQSEMEKADDFDQIEEITQFLQNQDKGIFKVRY